MKIIDIIKKLVEHDMDRDTTNDNYHILAKTIGQFSSISKLKLNRFNDNFIGDSREEFINKQDRLLVELIADELSDGFKGIRQVEELPIWSGEVEI